MVFVLLFPALCHGLLRTGGLVDVGCFMLLLWVANFAFGFWFGLLKLIGC